MINQPWAFILVYGSNGCVCVCVGVRTTWASQGFLPELITWGLGLLLLTALRLPPSFPVILMGTTWLMSIDAGGRGRGRLEMTFIIWCVLLWLA